MKALHITVALRTTHSGGSVLYTLKLQEKLIGMAILTATIFPAIVGEDSSYLNVMFFKERQNILVKHMHGGYRQLAGIKSAPGITGIAGLRP